MLNGILVNSNDNLQNTRDARICCCPLIAAGVSAAGSIGSKLLGNAQARKMADYEFSNNLKMWNLQNAYNSPAQQMQRLKDAGLNLI